jgi:mannose-6-phosphate isomerase-like protein (cupin superfamily)
MPYVEPADANNQEADAIEAIKARNGSGNWRERIVASSRQRVVLLQWLPGTVHAPHHHPDAEEIFVVHAGRAEFTFDDDQIVPAEPGAVLYAEVGRRHGLRVVGDEPLLMMCFMAPNAADDQVPA